MSNVNIEYFNNTSNTDIDLCSTTIENIAIYRKKKNRKRNWDSSSDEELPTTTFQTSIKMARVDDSSCIQDKPIRKVINILKQSRKNKNNKSFQGPITKNCYSEEYFRKHNCTESEINSEPITENEKHLANNLNSYDNFLKKFTQNNLIENENCNKSQIVESRTQGENCTILNKTRSVPLTHFFKQRKAAQSTEIKKNEKEVSIVPSTTICRQLRNKKQNDLTTRKYSLDNFLGKITQEMAYNKDSSKVENTKSNSTKGISTNNKNNLVDTPQDEFTETLTTPLKENDLNLQNIYNTDIFSQRTELPSSKCFEDVLKSLKSMKSANDQFKINRKTNSNKDSLEIENTNLNPTKEISTNNKKNSLDTRQHEFKETLTVPLKENALNLENIHITDTFSRTTELPNSKCFEDVLKSLRSMKSANDHFKINGKTNSNKDSLEIENTKFNPAKEISTNYKKNSLDTPQHEFKETLTTPLKENALNLENIHITDTFSQTTELPNSKCFEDVLKSLRSMKSANDHFKINGKTNSNKDSLEIENTKFNPAKEISTNYKKNSLDTPQHEFKETLTTPLKENALNLENIHITDTFSQTTELPNSKCFEDVLKSLRSMKSANDHFKINGKTNGNKDSLKVENTKFNDNKEISTNNKKNSLDTPQYEFKKTLTTPLKENALNLENIYITDTFSQITEVPNSKCFEDVLKSLRSVKSANDHFKINEKINSNKDSLEVKNTEFNHIKEISTNNKLFSFDTEFTETLTTPSKEKVLNMEKIHNTDNFLPITRIEDVLKSLRSLKSANDKFKIDEKTNSKIEHKSIQNENSNEMKKLANNSQDEGRISVNMAKTESSNIFLFSASQDNGTEILKTESSSIFPKKEDKFCSLTKSVANTEIVPNKELSERNFLKNSDKEYIEMNMIQKLCSGTSYKEETQMSNKEFKDSSRANSSNTAIILNEFEKIENKSIHFENNESRYKNCTKLKTTNNLYKNPILEIIHSHNKTILSDTSENKAVSNMDISSKKDNTSISSTLDNININKDGGKSIKIVNKNVRESTKTKKSFSENNSTQNQSNEDKIYFIPNVEDNKSDKYNTGQTKKPSNNLLNDVQLNLILREEYEKCKKIQEKHGIITESITKITESNSKFKDRNNSNDSTQNQAEEDDIFSNTNVENNNFDGITEKNRLPKSDISSTNQTKTSCEKLLNDEQLNLILREEYEKSKKREEKYGPRQHAKETKITKLIEDTKLKNKPTNKMGLLKRYRKGKLKIYRLKKAKKPSTSQPPKEDLNIETILEKLTQNYIDPESKLNRSKSYSSDSTSSSYVTDESRSETMSSGSRDLTLPQSKLRAGLNNLLKDKTMVCRGEESFFSEYDKSEIKRKIQDIFLQVFDDLTNGRRSVLKFRRQCLANCTFTDGRLQFKSEDPAMTLINSNAQNSQNRFKLILYILKKVQTLLETNTKLTKRELFYQLKDMISNQSVIDRAINTVSCLLDVGMWALNIVAQKGLVFGDLKIVLSNGETINCKIPGTLIPQDIEDIIEIQSIAYFILVVEKESVFHKLIEENLPNKLTRPFIMITGKGFPDLNTQLFLRKLWIVMSIPVFILVDADPDGIQIMLNYRFGSVNNAHVSHHLAVPNAKWLGIYPSEIKDFDVTTQPLTSRELKLVQSLLKTPHVVNNHAISSELKVMYEHQYKAGIEAMMKSMIFLSEVYLPTKFFIHKFI